VTELRRKRVSPAEKLQLDQQLKDLRKQETDLKTMFEQTSKTFEKNPDNSNRPAFVKLYKDLEKLMTSLEAVFKESLKVKIDPMAAASATNNKTSAFGGSIGKVAYDDDSGNGGRPAFAASEQQAPTQQQMLIRPVMQEHDIDQLMVEERERDILKLNQDIAIVHDMMIRMADIVGEQGEKVEQIHGATEVSHERAEAGLQQIKKAAEYQPVCTIS